MESRAARYAYAMPEKTDTQPPNKIDAMVRFCSKRCLASGSPLAVLAEVLEVLTVDPTWTVFEIEEVRRQVVRDIADRVTDLT